MFVGHVANALAAKKLDPRPSLGTFSSSPFGPHPPSVRAAGIVNTSLRLLLAWAAWVDRHRLAREGAFRPE